MINIAELLRNCSKGTKFYSPLFGEVELLSVDSLGTIYISNVMGTETFNMYGYFYSNYAFKDAECLLFPSKDHRTWEDWVTPVEPKFKVGDWIINQHGFLMQITKVTDNFYQYNYDGESYICNIEQAHRSCHLWTIEDAEDGDVLVYQEGFHNDEIFLFNIVDKAGIGVLYYCCYDGDIVLHSFYSLTDEELRYIKPATKEQRDLLFVKMKEAGYEWDSDKKELKKIKPHYDISNFKAGMPVLVRDDNEEDWVYGIFSHYCKNIDPFVACCFDWRQCIPYEGNEHLLGTTDMCDEQFINW